MAEGPQARSARMTSRSPNRFRPYAGHPPPGLYRTARPDFIIRLAAAAVSSFVSVVMSLGGDREQPELAHAPNRRTMLLAGRRSVSCDGSVAELTFTADDNRTLPGWHPGAHIDVHLPSGRTRQYSLCGDPQHRQQYRIAVRRDPCGDGGSVELHELCIGQTVQISDPRNAFMMPIPGSASRATKLRFIAGGIGITPILPMVRLAERIGVQWSLRYVGRGLDSLPFLDELAAFGDKVEVHPTGAGARPSPAEMLDGVDDRTAVYLCGPPAMVAALRQAISLKSAGEFHVERFGPPAGPGGPTFEVRLARSATTVQVGADQSTLSALLGVLPNISYSCRRGFCGTCVQRVLDGDVEHRDAVLTDQQRELGQMLVCVSRAAASQSGPLVLDL